MGEKTGFSTNRTGIIGHLHAKGMNMGSFLIAHIKINSKWIKGPKVKVKTIRFLEENFGIILPDFELVNDFLDITSKAQTTKEKSR